MKVDYWAYIRRTVSGSYQVNLPAGEAKKFQKFLDVDDVVGVEVRVVLVVTRP
jgi:hypothetical protein